MQYGTLYEFYNHCSLPLPWQCAVPHACMLPPAPACPPHANLNGGKLKPWAVPVGCCSRARGSLPGPWAVTGARDPSRWDVPGPGPGATRTTGRGRAGRVGRVLCGSVRGGTRQWPGPVSPHELSPGSAPLILHRTARAGTVTVPARTRPVHGEPRGRCAVRVNGPARPGQRP